MKYFKVLTFLLFLSFIGNQVQAAGIDFKNVTTWEELVEMATELQKPIFVDGYASWCGPCKKMSKEVFSDERVGNWYNKQFINVKLDLEAEGMGKMFAEKHQIKAYPTLLYFSPSGDFLHRVAGYHDIDQFVELGINATDPEKQLSSMMVKFQEGDQNADFLYAYAQALDRAVMDNDHVIESYLKTQNAEELISEKNWKLISEQLYDAESPYFDKVLSMQDQLSEKHGRAEVRQYIEHVYTYKMHDVAKTGNENKLNALQLEIKSTVPSQQYELIAKSNYTFYRNDEEKSHIYAVKYFDRYCTSANELNGIAWKYFESTDDIEKLQKAVNWVNRSIEFDANWYNTDTKANLLYKLDMLPQAKKTAIEAIALAKRNGEDPQETEALLKKIESDIGKSNAR